MGKNSLLDISFFIFVIGSLSIASYAASFLKVQSEPSTWDIAEQISKSFADHRPYINDSYDCKNFSRDYQIKMSLNGYEVYQVSNGSHRYNCIAIEPQSGDLRKQK